MCLYVCVCFYAYSCMSGVQQMTKLNLSFRKLSIQLIQNLDPCIFLSHFFRNVKDSHVLLFLSSIFYSSAQLECIRFLSVLSVSTYRHVFPYWVSVTSSSNVYPVSVCYHSFWTPVSTCLPIFPLISSFQSCPKWIGLIFDIHILLSIHLSYHLLNFLDPFWHLVKPLKSELKIYTCSCFYKGFFFNLYYMKRHFNLLCCIF